MGLNVLNRNIPEIAGFDYVLPGELIAQYPAASRDKSRLMTMDRATGALEEGHFSDITRYLKAGDLLILNNTRVLPARIRGKKSTGGGVEFLLVERIKGKGVEKEEVWRCLARPARGLVPGKEVFFDGGEGGIRGEITGVEDGGFRLLTLKTPASDLLNAIGEVPLPPYIRRKPVDMDSERYQTVFARVPGAVAAPTAGLHFTEKTLDDIKSAGVQVQYITLHTGPATFMPVSREDGGRIGPDSEYFKIDRDVFASIMEAKKQGRRVIAVGTTTTRALEGSVAEGFASPALTGRTGLFIRPGFEFKVIDALITNFHLPRTTLLMLVSAFAGTGHLRRAYKEAVRWGYRFYSYGDAMLIK